MSTGRYGAQALYDPVLVKTVCPKTLRLGVGMYTPDVRCVHTVLSSVYKKFGQPPNLVILNLFLFKSFSNLFVKCFLGIFKVTNFK